MTCSKLFTDDAVLIVGSTVYVGRGDVNTTCVPGSLTICDFFQNHAGSFVLGRNWAALTSLAHTHFEVHGKRADVYFECHYFDVATAAKKSDRLVRAARTAQHGSGAKSTRQLATVIRRGWISDSLIRVLSGTGLRARLFCAEPCGCQTTRASTASDRELRTDGLDLLRAQERGRCSHRWLVPGAMYPCEKLPRLVNRVLPPPERRIAYKNLNVHQITVGLALRDACGIRFGNQTGTRSVQANSVQI